jgi:hypothetical protein
MLVMAKYVVKEGPLRRDDRGADDESAVVGLGVVDKALSGGFVCIDIVGMVKLTRGAWQKLDDESLMPQHTRLL